MSQKGFLDINEIFKNDSEFENVMNYCAAREPTFWRPWLTTIDESNQSGSGVEDLLQLKLTSSTFNDKFGYTLQSYDIELPETTGKTFLEVTKEYNDLFPQLYTKLLGNIKSTDRLRLEFNHDLFTSPVLFPFMKQSDFTSQILMDRFEYVVQSYKLPAHKLQSKHRFSANLMIVHMPTGSYDEKQPAKRICKEKKSILTFHDFLNNTGSIKVVLNKGDNLCLLRAILIAKLFVDRRPDAKNIYYNQNCKKLKQMVSSLCKAIGVFRGPCGIDVIQKIEAYFGEYQIMLISGNGKTSKEPLYLNKSRPFAKYIYICLHEGHYYAITSMLVFTDRSYYCDHCKAAFSQTGQHKCIKTCKSCCRLNCDNSDSTLTKTCSLCKAVCSSEECLNLHQEFHCRIKNLCKICNGSRLRHHVCGNQSKWCPNCKSSVELTHACFILTEKEKCKRDKINETKFEGYIFFDYEAYVDEKGVHIPNLIMAHVICVNCLESDSRCETCLKKYIFYTNEEFCIWLLAHENFIALAHNMKGYDGIFIANFCVNILKSQESLPKMIATPTKLLSIQFRKLKIIDSCSFLAMPLSSFSSTFDLKELKKGFFPHKFNKPENMNYVGRYPAKEDYGYQYFTTTKKEEFEIFYEANVDKQFNFKQEFEDYCWSDVSLLTEGCLKFRKIIMQQTKLTPEDKGVDPFRVAITIASLCNYIYRRNFMPSKSIALIPENGYNPEQNCSEKSMLWLKFLSETRKIHIQHAKNGGELRVGKYLVDGYCAQTKTIFEFNGCYWHGCLKCPGRTYGSWNPTRNHTMGYLNKITHDRINEIQQTLPDHTIVTIWECEFDKMCENEPALTLYCAQNPIVEKLKPRCALYGGRTNAFKLHHNCDKDEKIMYYDFTSLYPAVQKQEKFPVGHPIKITECFEDLSLYFGLIKCKVVAPRRLYIPVLPTRINNKLVFPLCYACAQSQEQGYCRHDVTDREFIGTWTTIEVEKARKMGYVISKIYEIWHFEERENIFESYVNACMKEKQEASGFPGYCKTEDEKDQYIEEYFEKESIHLEKKNISKNISARQIAKIKANSLWGYLAMKTNKCQHKFISSKAELYLILLNDQFIVHQIIPNDALMQIYFSTKDEAHFGGLTTNVVVASFVTSYARLRLYNAMHLLGERLLYCDTDSIIFVTRPGCNDPITGNYLGDFTNEIDSDEGKYIQEFVSAGPKNYAYKLDTGITHCTVKGFTLNNVAKLTINYDSIKNIVCADNSKKLGVKQLKFSRDPKKWENRTDEVEKWYGFVYDKRQLRKDLTTLPYGF